MRFFENGPDIPDQLIAAREEGRVVFFCGAGVSVPAGLPSFLTLTQGVMQKLGVSRQSNGVVTAHRADIDYACSDECPNDYRLPFSLDQAFYLLQQEYGLEAVEQEVNAHLKIKTGTSAEKHRTILRLARNQNQQPQIVTTNFDLLFEQANKSVKTHIPPALPDLSCGQPLEGVVYLHGRWSKTPRPAGSAHRLIISSADFGRAYLADGWANRFIKQLASQYVIVLLGYRAEDPPVRYLLEGLHTSSGSSSALIYAFDRGSQEHVDQNWRHRGVSGIAFPGFDDLWSSLNAWADFSDDPSAWYAATRKLAQQGPRDLKSFERRQVTYLVSTDQGAKFFADSTPQPCAEWLCVFDPYLRNAKPETIRSYKEGVEDCEFVPQANYGLDNDPVVDHDGTEPIYRGVGFLTALPNESKSYVELGLAQASPEALPQHARLKYLGMWLGKLLHDPHTLWWAAGKVQLHPQLLRVLELKLNDRAANLPPELDHLWRLLIEQFKHAPNDQYGDRWYHFKDKKKKLGWNNYLLRELERVLIPYLSVQRCDRYFRRLSDTIELSAVLHGAVRVELRFTRFHGDALDVPDEYLSDVFAIWRSTLDKAAKLALELPYFISPNIFGADQTFSSEEDAAFFLKCCVAFFDRLVALHPNKARKELACWPEHEPYFFDQLRIYAWQQAGLFESDEIATGLLFLSEGTFWNSNYRSALLGLINLHWPMFSCSSREQLENRIIAGPLRDGGDNATRPDNNDFYTVIRILGWLDQQGCSLSDAAHACLSKLRQNSDWYVELETDESERWLRRAGHVKTDKNPDSLLKIPLHQITTVTQEKTNSRNREELIDYRPFSGLVESHPLRGLKALVLDAKQDRYPLELWNSLLSKWPESQPVRLCLQVARRLLQLPVTEIAKISHPFSQWLSTHLPVIAKTQAGSALDVWDQAIELLILAGDDSLKSGVGNTYYSGRLQPRSRRTREHAINAPLGHMTQALFTMVCPEKGKAGVGLPQILSQRIKRLLSTKGESVDHVLNQIAIRLDWLFWLDPKWTKEHLLPLFDLKNKFAEPVWNGRLHDNRHFSPELFAELKPQFIELFQSVQEWQWGRGLPGRLHQHLVLACRYGVSDPRYLSFEEAREILQLTDDAGRAEALRFLAFLPTSRSNWRQFGKLFIQEAWPRELRFRSDAITKSFLYMAEKTTRDFPDVVKTILPLLIPVKRCDTLFYRSSDEAESSLSSRHPDAMLSLLDRILDDASIPPYQLDGLLDQITAAKPKLSKDRRMLRLKALVNFHV